MHAVSPVTEQTPPQSAAQKPGTKEIMDKARQIYYVLQDRGLLALQCNVQPDWKKVLDSTEGHSVAADNAMLILLIPVSYSAVVDERGGLKLAPVVATGGAVDPSVAKIVESAQKMLEGFLQTWVAMELSTPFPPSDDANLIFSEQQDGYHFTEKSGEQNVEFILTRDYVLTTTKVAAPGVVVVMHPKFTKTDKGLLMTGSDSDLNNGAQKIGLQIQYQTLEGFQLPEKVFYQASFQDANLAMEMTFTKYRLTKR
jgi:hypothetical protein